MAPPAIKERVLITGGSGFVGRHCLPLIDPNRFEVVAVGKEALSLSMAERKFQIHGLDLFDGEAIRLLLKEYRPKYLLHLAWEATPGSYWTSPLNHDWVEASFFLHEEFLKNGGERSVFAGTVAEYDWTQASPFSEDSSSLNPATLYGQCKLELFRRLMKTKRGSFAWARLFYLYGPYEVPGRLVSGAFHCLYQGESFPSTDGAQIRDYLHVEDAARALLAILLSNATGAFNIGSGDRISVRQILEVIGRVTGRSDLIEFGKILQRPNDPPEIVADVTRLKNELKWRPRYSLEEGLTATSAWWKNRAKV